MTESAPSTTEAAILTIALEQPRLGQAAIADKLRAGGISISPSGVRYILQKHNLETAVKRLQAIENSGANTLSADERRLLDRGRLSNQLTAADDARELANRREIILQKAAEYFATQGYDRTSIRDIAAAVGLLPGSVYHHFSSKKELYLDIHQTGFASMMVKIQTAAASTDDPWQKLHRVCQVHMESMFEGAYVERVTGHALAMVEDHDLMHFIRSERHEYERVFRTLIDGLPLQQNTDKSLLRLTLLGALNWSSIWYREGKKTPAEIARLTLDMLRHGVDKQSG